MVLNRFMDNDEKYMLEAIKEAYKAQALDEVPVGCVIVKDNIIIARGHNLREMKNDSTMHAEMVAIRKACTKLSSWRLNGCSIYVTIEPCTMCAGAIMWSRFDRLIYGAKDTKGGAIVSSFHLFDSPNINHHPEIVGGILESECSSIIKNYFKNKRKF